MNFFSALPTRLSTPGWAAALTVLALLAGEALGQTVSRPPAQRPSSNPSATSRYAAKQVRVPGEPEAPMKKTVAAKQRPVHQDQQVRPVQHQESYGRTRSVVAPRTASRIMRSRMQPQGEMMETEMMEGEIVPEQVATPEGEMQWEHGELVQGGGDGGCGDGDCGGSCGGNACGSGRNNCCLIPCPTLRFDNFEFFAGAQGFTGPLNRGESGSFGFHEGFNWANAFSLPCTHRDGALSMQLGMNATQSSFAGSDITDQDRRQIFVTGGFFRRADWGLQGGAVVDYMHDEWYYDKVELTQVRGELSWVFPECHELGFWFTQGMGTTTSQSTIMSQNRMVSTGFTEQWAPTDLYAAFYRRRFEECGATGRLFGGFTSESDGLVGADFSIPLSESWAVRTGFTYLIPGENQSSNGYTEESWNVGMSVVWYPGCRTARNHDYNRPLFNVADNGSFMVDRK